MSLSNISAVVFTENPGDLLASENTKPGKLNQTDK